MLHLDAASQAPLRPEARDAWLAAAQLGGNPSSPHSLGRQAAARLEAAREQVAKLLGAKANELVFTSGGTEAVNLMIRGAAAQLPEGRVLVANTEHASALAAALALGPGHPVELLPVGEDGVLAPATLMAALSQGPTALVVAMVANNETGAIHRISALATLAHAKGARLASDVCQATPWADPVAWMGADYLAASGAKLGAGPGAGVVACRLGAPLSPLLLGGAHERGKRAGTPNLPAIAAFGAAAEAAMASKPGEAARLSALREALWAGVSKACPDAFRLVPASVSAPHILSFAVPGLRGEAAVERLDLEGILAGTGAACTTLSKAPSHVLRAMGLPEAMVMGSVRLSLSWATTEAEVAEAGPRIGQVLRRQAAMLPMAPQQG